MSLTRMPNGFHGSKEEWERLVAPLLQFDAALDEFGARHGIAVDRNYHNMPNRMLTWKRAGIVRQIEIDLYGRGATNSVRVASVSRCRTRASRQARAGDQRHQPPPFPRRHWTPFSLTEAEYETLVAELPKIWKSARKSGKPRFPLQQIRIDPGLASAKTFEEWVTAVTAKYPPD